jgi:hypothetical protein
MASALRATNMNKANGLTDSRLSAPVRCRWIYALVTIGLSVALATAATLALDIYVHQRLAKYAALNVWGYRGPVVGRKKPGNRRIVIIGGSTVFGVAFSVNEAFPAVLSRLLERQSSTPISVVNLGFPAENAYAYRAVEQDYAYLNTDLVVLYGEKNANGTLAEVMRDDSLVYRLTGYYPLLPTALREKAFALRYEGDLNAAYAHARAPSHTSLPTRMAAAVLGSIWSVTNAATSHLDRVGQRPPEPAVHLTTCAPPWTSYCDAMYRAIVFARCKGQTVLVVTQPDAPEQTDVSEEQQALRTMLRERFQSDRDVWYLDLSRAVDVHDRTLAFEGSHLTPLGNQRVAERLAEYLGPWLRGSNRR